MFSALSFKYNTRGSAFINIPETASIQIQQSNRFYATASRGVAALARRVATVSVGRSV